MIDEAAKNDVEREESEVQTAETGKGRLLRRSYKGVVANSKVSATELVEIIRRDLPLLVPAQYAIFRRVEPSTPDLRLGDKIEIWIQLSGRACVRVSEVNAHAMTLQTLDPHPEAGRITFTVRDLGNNLEIVIQSRARASGFINMLGYIVIGRAMQTRTWVGTIKNAAQSSGGILIGDVEVKTVAVAETPEDRDPIAPSTIANSK